jgi:hypothetical protein
MRAREFIIDGIGGQFISGMTGGQATSLKDLGKLGVAKAAGKLGFNTTAGNIANSIRPDGEIDVDHLPPDMKNMSTKDLTDALGIKVGMVTFIGGQQVKIKSLDSEGIDGIELKGKMPVNYPKEALMMMLAKQRSQRPQQGQQ